MSDASSAVQAAKESMEHAARAVSPWVDRLGRAGQAAHGIVYLVVGSMALETAVSGSGHAMGVQGALAGIARRPHGPDLLALLILGLIAYAVWQGFRAVANPDYEPESSHGLWRRLGWAFTALVYAGLAAGAARLLARPERRQSDDAIARGWSALALSAPFGRWLLALIGVGVVLGGVWTM
jgi:Domain of Unknown Function (DUF1206)